MSGEAHIGLTRAALPASQASMLAARIRLISVRLRPDSTAQALKAASGQMPESRNPTLRSFGPPVFAGEEDVGPSER